MKTLMKWMLSLCAALLAFDGVSAQEVRWTMKADSVVGEQYRLLFEAEIHEKTGAEAVFVVQGEAKEVKRRLCLLEDGCAMGRLLDVDVIAPDGEYTAQACGIDETGALLVHDENGSERRVLCGDVSVRGLMGYV